MDKSDSRLRDMAYSVVCNENREMFEIANWVLGRIAFDVKG